ncbi:MAG: ABC transporter ATP-binding protein [bacterium]
MRLELDNVTKRFGDTVAVSGLSLTVEPGELFFLLGPSGCGKTTCLRMVAGFETPDEGRVLFDGRDATHTPSHRRNAGMVFQHYALFPHLTARQNVEYGLRFRNMPKAERRRRAEELLDALQIGGLAARQPAQLSGGQQQRVALARALVIRPDILLLDEPLSNLDARLRTEMREEIRRLHALFGYTGLYVTHDQEEALSLADRLAVMRGGRIEQAGTPEEVYSRPRSAFVARFVGDSNVIEATVKGRDADGAMRLETEFGDAVVSAPSEWPSDVVNAAFSVLPEHVQVEPGGEKPPARSPFDRFAWRMKVAEAVFSGSVTRVVLESGKGGTLRAKPAAGADMPRAGERAWVSFGPEDAVMLEE